MKAEALILYDSHKILSPRLDIFKNALRHFGFCCFWCDLAHEPAIVDAREYAAIVALHRGVEQSFSAQLAFAIDLAFRRGAGFVSFDHDFPNDASWIDRIRRSGHRNTTSFRFAGPDDFILSWKQPGQVVRWTTPLTIAQTSYENDAYDPLAWADDTPVILRHRHRPEIRFFFDSSYWFTADHNHSFGMVDLFWKAIISASRKPFAVLSVPPFVTARIDDCNGTRRNFSYVPVFNQHGIKPNLGLFLDHIPPQGAMVDAMRQLQDQRTAQFSAHAFDPFHLLFARRAKGPYPDETLAKNFEAADQTFKRWRIRPAQTVNPHWGHIGCNCAQFFKQYDLHYLMLQLQPGEIIDHPPLYHWHPKPFANYAFVAEQTPHMSGLFSLISHWHPDRLIKPLDCDSYAVDLEQYSHHVDCLFGRTAFDAERYYAAVRSDPIDERPWKNAQKTNQLAQAAAAAAQGVKLALESSFFGCITTHEYSLAVLDDIEIDDMLTHFDILLKPYERLTMDVDSIAAYMKTHAASKLTHCSLLGDTLQAAAQLVIPAQRQLYLAVYNESTHGIIMHREPFIDHGQRPGLVEKTFPGV